MSEGVLIGRPKVMRTPRAGWLVPAAAVLVSTALVLGPLFGRGYVLAYDMVFAPRMPLGADELGLGSALPRAVPSDLVVALLGRALPGYVVQQAVLAALLLAAGFGAARLAAPAPLARTAAALAYLWTPLVGERLLLGQWAVLVGWAVLPWLYGAALRLRADGSVRSWCTFAAVLGVQCLGGAPAWVLALLVAPVTVAWRRPPAMLRSAGALLLLAVYALPWALPALLRPGGVHADPQGAVAFAPASDTPLGIVGSVLTGGGTWNSRAVPPGRDAWPAALGALLVLVIGLAGVVTRLRVRRDRLAPDVDLPTAADGLAQPAPGGRSADLGPLAVAAPAGLALVLAAAWLPGARALAHVPGAALVRDAARLLVPWTLLVALGFAAAVGDSVRRVRAQFTAVVVLLAVLPVAVLPTLAWGVAGRLDPVHYPRDVAAVREQLAGDPRAGAVLVLPFEAYRRYRWNGRQVSLDVLPRVLPRPVVVSSDLVVLVGGRQLRVAGEDRLAARAGRAVRAAAAGGTPLPAGVGALGVRWVAVDAAVPPALLSGLTPVRHGRDVTLYEVPATQVRRAGHPYAGYAPPRAPVLIGDALAALVLIASGLCTAATAVRGLLRSGRR